MTIIRKTLFQLDAMVCLVLYHRRVVRLFITRDSFTEGVDHMHASHLRVVGQSYYVCARVWHITAVATQATSFPHHPRTESSSMGSQLYVKKKLTRYIYINN